MLFDIETMPQADLKFDKETVKLGNLKDEAKIAAKVKAAEKAFYSEAALHPAHGQIISIGIIYQDDPIRLMHAMHDGKYSKDQEKSILQRFWELFKDEQKVVGFNTWFDMSYINERSNVLNVPNRISDWDYYRRKIVDVMEIAHGGPRWAINNIWPSGTGSLAAFAKRYGVTSKYRGFECSGAEYADYLLSGDDVKVKAAEAHLRADLEETRDVAERVQVIL